MMRMRRMMVRQSVRSASVKDDPGTSRPGAVWGSAPTLAASFVGRAREARRWRAGRRRGTPAPPSGRVSPPVGRVPRRGRVVRSSRGWSRRRRAATVPATVTSVILPWFLAAPGAMRLRRRRTAAGLVVRFVPSPVSPPRRRRRGRPACPRRWSSSGTPIIQPRLLFGPRRIVRRGVPLPRMQPRPWTRACASLGVALRTAPLQAGRARTRTRPSCVDVGRATPALVLRPRLVRGCGRSDLDGRARPGRQLPSRGFSRRFSWWISWSLARSRCSQSTMLGRLGGIHASFGGYLLECVRVRPSRGGGPVRRMLAPSSAAARCP
mmetsp:Transcript_19362/g.56596  ORF Transcript_19362/g.56596 Transcript_19362/m.56596 type:complete len:322 (+) Transcript_19362:878-1843(+)